MEKTFTIKGITFKFFGKDVIQAADVMKPGARGGVKFYAKVQNQLYPVRQLLVEMIRQEGEILPDITTHEAIRVLRGLGYKIHEV